MKKITLLFVILISFAAVNAQERLLTLDDIYAVQPNQRVSFAGTSTRVIWSNEGNYFKETRDGKLMRVDAVTGKAEPLYDSSRFSKALQDIAKFPAARAEQMANSVGLRFSNDDSAVLFEHETDLWLYDVKAGSLKRLTNSSERKLEADLSPDGKKVSFVQNNDLYVIDVATTDIRRLTFDGSVTVHNGILVWVYEEELYGRGRKRGYWWSPDSTRIAYLRLDDAPVPKFILSDETKNDPVIESTNYPKAGDPNPLVQLGIAEISRGVPVGQTGNTTTFVDLKNYDPKDVLIARVAWTPDARNVVFQALNREQTFLDLNLAAADGKVTKLLTEKTPAWVEVHGNPRYLRDGSFIWESDRTGWKHFYHYAADGKLIRQLTEGRWEARSFYGVDEKNGFLYFSGTRESAIAENVYRVPLKGGAVQRLTEGEGTHAGYFSTTMEYFVHTWSDLNTPPQTRLRRADGSLERVLNANQVDVLKEFKLGETKFLKVKTRDGFEMEASIILPPDFDPNKKYPVLQYSYAGPHSQTVINRWGGNRYMWHQMLAQKGYIIWLCDNRSASGKGQESVWPIYKQMGVLELQDIEDGISYLKTLPYVDHDRIGIWGWSFGGYITSYALTNSKNFKIGIAGGSVTDWRLYDTIYTERYMATPQNNPEGYTRTSVINSAKNLSGKLMLIHGVMDDNVHQQNTIQLAFELQKNQHQFDLMLYPTQRHGVSNPAQARHMYQMMTDFILKNL